MIFRASTQDETKCFYYPNKCLKTKSLGSCTGLGYVILSFSKTVLGSYDQENEQKGLEPNYQKLKTMVKKFLDQKVRIRNFEARNERTVTGTPAKSKGKGRSFSAERMQGDCYQWKAKQVFQGERMQVPSL